MSLRKVYGGTPTGTESRCDTCSQAAIITGYAESEKLVFCDALYPTIRIPFSVRECSMYEDKRLPEFEQMEKIAWQISSKSAGHAAGFVLLSDVKATSSKQSKQAEEQPAENPAAVSENE